jgi:hypothetical protein
MLPIVFDAISCKEVVASFQYDITELMSDGWEESWPLGGVVDLEFTHSDPFVVTSKRRVATILKMISAVPI